MHECINMSCTNTQNINLKINSIHKYMHKFTHYVIAGKLQNRREREMGRESEREREREREGGRGREREGEVERERER